MLVMKFGGTSVQDSTALQRVLSIVQVAARTHRCIVVLSATSKTTDALLHLARTAAVHDKTIVDEQLQNIRRRHLDIAASLLPDGAAREEALARVHVLCDDLTQYCTGLAILRECTAESLDMVASFGERLSTSIFEAACKAAGIASAYLDVRSVMRTDDTFMSAAVNMQEVHEHCHATLLPMLNDHSVVVTQGFVGSTSDGRTTTLGRGGSDYTAAILGAACGAEEIQIWTDVSGVFTTDPRLVETARPIPAMSFQEVRELAIYGAKVLHPETIAPAIDANIAVCVLNTFRPDEPGTRITAHQPADVDIHAVTVVRSCVEVQSAVELELIDDVAAHVLLRTTTAERATTIVRTPTESVQLALDVALAGMTVTTHSVAVIAVCGPRVATPASVKAIAHAAPQARMIVSGSSDVTTFVVVADDDALHTVRSIHALL